MRESMQLECVYDAPSYTISGELPSLYIECVSISIITYNAAVYRVKEVSERRFVMA